MAIIYTNKVAAYSNAKERMKRIEEVIGEPYYDDYECVQKGLSALNNYFQALFENTDEHNKSNEYFNCMVVISQAMRILELYKRKFEETEKFMNQQFKERDEHIKQLKSDILQPLIDEAIEDYKAKLIQFIDEDLYNDYY